ERQRIFGGRRVLGIRANAPTEDLVTWPKPGHAVAHGLHLPRHVSAPDSVLWLAQPVHRAGDVWQAAHDGPVGRVDAGSPNANQHLGVADLGFVDVPEFQNVGGTVRVLN